MNLKKRKEHSSSSSSECKNKTLTTTKRGKSTNRANKRQGFWITITICYGKAVNKATTAAGATINIEKEWERDGERKNHTLQNWKQSNWRWRPLSLSPLSSTSTKTSKKATWSKQWQSLTWTASHYNNSMCICMWAAQQSTLSRSRGTDTSWRKKRRKERKPLELDSGANEETEKKQHYISI